MTALVALLAGVNVSGRGKVPMAELREAAAELGLARPRTLLASGNLVFESDAGEAELEARLARLLAERFGLERKVMVRSAADWSAAIAANPMPAEAEADPGRLLLMTLEREAAADAVERLAEHVVAPERIEVRGRFAYGWYPEGVGGSKQDPKRVDRALGCRNTARNWNTVLKIEAMLTA